MRLFTLGTLLCLAGNLLTDSRAIIQDKNKPEPPDCIEIVSEGMLREINDYIDQKDWSSLMEHYRYLTEEPEAANHLRKMYPDPDIKLSYVSFPVFIMKLFSKLPRPAIVEFRLKFDHKVAPEFTKARDKWELAVMEKLLERYFFSSYSDEIMESLANYYMEQGNVKRASTHLKNLLNYPYGDVNTASVIAKLAVCYKMLGKPELVNELKKYKSAMDDTVAVAGKRYKLEDFLTSSDFKFTVGGTNTISIPDKLDPKQIYEKTGIYPKADIFKEAKQYGHSARITGSTDTHFPIIPAYATVDGKEVLIVQDGQKLIVIDSKNGKYLFNSQVTDQTKIDKPSLVNDPYGYGRYGQNSEYGPFIGCQLEGNLILTNMFLNRLKVSDLTEQNRMYGGISRKPAPLNSLRAYDVKSYKLKFSTDDAINQEREKDRKKDKTAADFAKGDFSFSLPVIWQENRLYVGLVSWQDSISEQSSYVACFELDNNSLKLAWHTLLSSKSLPQTPYYQGRSNSPLCPTFILEKEGIIYACSNTGSVSAVDSYTGRILWMHIYAKPQETNKTTFFSRIPNYPIIHNDILYFLPMDDPAMVVIDTVTGKKLSNFKETRFKISNEWQSITHLQGIVKGPVYDFMVLSGSKGTYILKLYSGDKVDPSGDCPGETFTQQQGIRTAVYENNNFKTVAGHGFVWGDFIFIPAVPTQGKSDGEICVIHAGPWINSQGKVNPNGSWKMKPPCEFGKRHSVKKQYGNLLLAGDKIIIASEENLILYESKESFMDNTKMKLEKDPMNHELIEKAAFDLFQNKKYEEAIELFLKLHGLCVNDASKKSLLADTKRKLYESYLNLGIDQHNSSVKRALNYYKNAKSFASTTNELFNTLYRLGSIYEKEKEYENAVKEYQEILTKAPKELVRVDNNTQQQSWLYAWNKIEQLKKINPECYKVIEREASKALKNIRPDIAAYLGFIDNYPNSSSVQGAITKILNFLDGVEPERVAGIIQSIKKRYESLLDHDAIKKLIDALEKLQDEGRLDKEFKFLLRKFSDATVNWSGQSEKISEFVSRKLVELKQTSEIFKEYKEEKIATVKSSSAVSLVVPLGSEPVSVKNVNHIFVLNGNEVEVWDTKTQKLCKTIKHPGCYLGIKLRALYSEVLCEGRLSGSPLSEIQKGDVIIRIDDIAVTPENFSQVAVNLKDGKHTVTFLRGRDTKVETCNISSDWNTKFVGACYTSDYSIALCWQDCATSINLKSFDVNWIYSRTDLGDITSLSYSDGKVLVLHEMLETSALYTVIKPTPEEIQEGKKLILYSSLACLDDQHGAAEWINTFETGQLKGASILSSFNSGNCFVGVTTKPKITTPKYNYYYDYSYNPQPQMFSISVKVFDTKSGKAVREASYSNLFDMNVNSSEQSLSFLEKGSVSAIDLNSNEYVSFNYDKGQSQNTSISSDGNYVVVVTDKIVIFNLKTKKRIKEVSIGTKSTKAWIIDSCVFVQVQDQTSQGQKPKNAQIFAFDLSKGDSEVKDLKLMGIPTCNLDTIKIHVTQKHFIVMYDSAIVDGSTNCVTAVYDRIKGGRLEKVTKGGTKAISPSFYRGNIFMVNKDGDLDIYK